MTFAEAATRYLTEESQKGKASLVTETYLLSPVVEMIGELPLDQIHDGTLRRFIDLRLAQGRAVKTVNLSLAVVRHILNVAARKWRVDLPGGRSTPVLHNPPLITLLSLAGKQRPPVAITWEEQKRLLRALPPHLARMSLFTLNTGLRDDVVVSLRWDWEVRLNLDGTEVSVFEVPRAHVKGRKEDRCFVCNSVAQSIVDAVRGQHPEYVFVWRRPRKRADEHYKSPPMPYRPVQTMNNTAWQSARQKAGLGDLHVHDLRHTVGARLREAGVANETRADILWHGSRSMTTHYSQAQVLEIRDALELIKKDGGKQNRTLRSLVREARNSRVPPESLQQRKTG